MRRSNTTKNTFQHFQESREFTHQIDRNKLLRSASKRFEDRKSIVINMPNKGSPVGNAKEIQRRFTLLTLREENHSRPATAKIESKTAKAPGPYMSLGASM